MSLALWMKKLLTVSPKQYQILNTVINTWPFWKPNQYLLVSCCLILLFLFFSYQNAKAILEKEPPIVMRNIHCSLFRKHILKSVLESSEEYMADRVCAYPFCVEPKDAKVDWVQCEECLQWVHIHCSGLTELVKDQKWTCIMCDIK